MRVGDTTNLPSVFQIGIPADFVRHFHGFTIEAFQTLAELREDPLMETLQACRDSVRETIQAPFRQYRDDLVAGGVLPHALPWETEKNVFSRLPKNDFGAGGVHHHLWMSFYRWGRTRLTDIQLMHSLHPEGFRFGIYVGERAGTLFQSIKVRLDDQAPDWIGLVNALIDQGYELSLATAGSTRRSAGPPVTTALSGLPFDPGRLRALWITRMIPAAEVLEIGSKLVDLALFEIARLWPLYLWLAESER